MLKQKPFMIILSAPSGAGKTTLCRALVEDDDRICYSVSATTRPQRGQEIDGEDYFFLSDDDFDRMRDQDGLLEWEEDGQIFQIESEECGKAESKIG